MMMTCGKVRRVRKSGSVNILKISSIVFVLVGMVHCSPVMARNKVGEKRLSIGIGYVPAYSNVHSFEIGTKDYGTLAVVPYKRDGRKVELKTGNFDWKELNPRIEFKDSVNVEVSDRGVSALEGSMGYGIGKARIEVEIGYEKFELKRDNGKNKIAESDAVYLLAKELAYDVMHNRTRKLARALEHVPGIDIVAFAAALKSWNPDVDRKVCNAVLEGGINNMGYCVPRKVRDDYDRIWGALEEVAPKTEVGKYERVFREMNLFLLANYLKRKRESDWTRDLKKYWEVWEDLERIRNSYQKNGFSTLYSDGASSVNWPLRGYSRDRKDAAAIEEGVVNTLTQEEKSEVAKILMRIVEGAEVVEIRAITTTSVMINACYDLFSEGIGIVPYACVGVGGNFVGVKTNTEPSP